MDLFKLETQVSFSRVELIIPRGMCDIPIKYMDYYHIEIDN